MTPPPGTEGSPFFTGLLLLGVAYLGLRLMAGAFFYERTCWFPLCRGGRWHNPIGRGTRPCWFCKGKKPTKRTRALWDLFWKGSRR